MKKKKISLMDLLILCLGNFEKPYVHMEDVYEEMYKKNKDQLSWKTKPYPDYHKLEGEKQKAQRKGLINIGNTKSKFNIELTKKGRQHFKQINPIVENENTKFLGKPSEMPKWVEISIKKIENDTFFISWNKEKDKSNSWKNIFDCYKVLEILISTKKDMLKQHIQKIIDSAYKYHQYKDIVAFLESTLENIDQES